MHRLRAAVLTVAFAALMQACTLPVDFAGPISEPDAAAAHDARLAGAWYARIEGELVYQLVISESGEPGQGLLEFVLTAMRDKAEITDNPEGMVSWVAGDSWPSEIDGELYYNIKLRRRDNDDSKHPPFREGQGAGYLIGHAAFPDDDTLRVSLIYPIILDSLIEDGQVPGDVLHDHVSSARAEIGGEELRELIRSYPADQLFYPFPYSIKKEYVAAFKRLQPTARPRPPDPK